MITFSPSMLASFFSFSSFFFSLLFWLLYTIGINLDYRFSVDSWLHVFIGNDLIILDLQAEPSKKKVKKINVPVVEVVYGGLAATDLQRAVEKEFEMALQDRVMEETKDKKNAVEAYVYDMRNKATRLTWLFWSIC